MLRVAVLGCGRIGQMHAANIARHARTELAMVYDVYAPAAQVLRTSWACTLPRTLKRFLRVTKLMQC